MKVAAIDTETTGFLYPVNVPLKRQPKIIEICVRFFDDENYIENENQYFTTLVNPKTVITKGITKVTGITQKELYNAPRWKDVRKSIIDRIQSAQRVVGHNLYFDKTMIDLEERRLGNDSVKWPVDLYCTNEHTEHLRQKRLKQWELFVHLTEEDIPEKIHRAKEDVEILTRIYMELKDLGLAEEEY